MMESDKRGITYEGVLGIMNYEFTTTKQVFNGVFSGVIKNVAKGKTITTFFPKNPPKVKSINAAKAKAIMTFLENVAKGKEL